MRWLPLSARETVATETPSSLAMSFIVMGVFFSGILPPFYMTKLRNGYRLLSLDIALFKVFVVQPFAQQTPLGKLPDGCRQVLAG